MSGGDARVPWNDPGPDRLFDIAQAEHFIVYIDRDMKVAWDTSPEFADAAQKQAPYDAAALTEILGDARRLDVQHAEAGQTTTRRFKELLGQAAARALAHDYQGARELLGDAGRLVPAAEETSDYRERWKHVIDTKVSDAEDSYQDFVSIDRDYIVYIDKSDGVVWETTSTYDQTSRTAPGFDLAALNLIQNQVEVMDAISTEQFSRDVILQFKDLLGTAVACALDYDYASARQMLADAQKFIAARSAEKSRYWYLGASLVAGAVVAAIGVAMWLGRTWAIDVLGPTGFWLALGADAGGIGALLSVIWRSGKLQFDSTAGRRLHYLEAASRIAAGAISGFVAGLAVKSGLIVATLTERADRANIVLLVAALAAGWGERLATSIISTFDAAQPKGVDGGDGGSQKKDGAKPAPRAAA
jgi:hypothetical protein